MGTQVTAPPGLADSLFSSVQQRVLGLLFGQPSRRFQSVELIRLAESGTGAVHRELKKLTQSGLVTASSVGNQKFYQANQKSPVFRELRGLVRKTVGIQAPLAEALLPFADRIRSAFVYGSFARGTETAKSDIDLMVLGTQLTYGELFSSLSAAEKRLSRTISPHVMTPAEWKTKLRHSHHFIKTVHEQPKLFIVGSPSDLEA